MRFADSRVLRLFGQCFVTRSSDTSVVHWSLSAQIYIISRRELLKPEVRSNNVAPMRPRDADMGRRLAFGLVNSMVAYCGMAPYVLC